MAKSSRSGPAPGRAQADETPRSSRGSVFRFVLVFALVMGGYYAASAIPIYRDTLFPKYLELNATVSGGILRALGQAVQTHGETISEGAVSISIKKGCDAIAPTMLFVAAVIAFPAPWRRRFIGMFVGAPVLLLINLVRIITLWYARKYASVDTFERLHVDVWQPAFIFLALVLWMIWAMRALPAPQQEQGA
ncbi:MAG: exosortase H [Phycisphaerales bacterium]|nr:exosortase H [Phycisphaerales bacterium]